MSAFNELELYKHEDYIESAIQSVLKANGLVNAFIQRETTVVATPRVGIQLTVGGATRHGGPRPDGYFTFNRWTGKLRCEITTDRTKENLPNLPEGEPVNHKDVRAIVRARLQVMAINNTAQGTSDFGSDILPWHQILDLCEAGTSPTVDDGQNHDVSTVDFDITWQLRDDAIPEEITP